MIKAILWGYIAIAVGTYWYDSSKLYCSMGYSYLCSVLYGAIDGLIWPVRWGWDIVVWLLNKKDETKRENK